MALHRDIHWIGRQWAVTGYGMQAIDQRHGGQFDVEIARLWDEDLLDRLTEQKWFNADDFGKGLAIARKRYPEPPRAADPEPEIEPEAIPEFEAEPAPEAEPDPESEPAPPPLLVALPLQANDFIAPPPEAAEALKPKTPEAEPPKQVPPAPPQDLLAKWFEAYGLNKTAASAPVPEPPRKAIAPEPVAKAPEQWEPIATAEPAPTMELPRTKSAELPPASPLLQMPIPGRARFIRPWRVQVQSVQSYRLR